jgi:hypothetical protein
MEYNELERLYAKACALSNHLYYRRQSDPRFARIYQKARERERRRGERLSDYVAYVDARDY